MCPRPVRPINAAPLDARMLRFVGVRLRGATLARLHELAHAQGRSLSDVLREAIEDWIEGEADCGREATPRPSGPDRSPPITRAI